MEIVVPEMTTLSQDIEVTSDSIFLLYQNLLGGLIISLIASAGMAFGFQHAGNNLERKVWFTLMVVVLLTRFADWLFWHKTKVKTEKKSQLIDLFRFRLGCFVTALVWSFYGVYFFDDMSSIEFSTTIIILASMAGGASTVLSADRVSSISYSAILLLPISLVGLTSDQAHHYVLGMLGLSFAGVMIISSLKSSKFTLQAIKIKHHNDQLVSSKDELLKEIHLQNEMLEEKVEMRTKEIVRVSNIDPLTNLANRKAFSTSLNDLISNAKMNEQSMAILFIDLDGFKAVNDQNGHATGDVVLARVAQRLSKTTSDKYYACRWGGDEFIVAMIDVDISQAKRFAAELIEEIKRPIVLSINSVRVGATIGISMFPEHGNTGDDLILLADTAMYKQKQTASSSVLVFSEQMREALLFKNKLKAGLEYALAKNQFHLTYQPVIDSFTNQITFCEALLRWRWDDESISPDDFIPIAEQYGFIHEIGAWVINQACEDAMKWELGNEVAISINVSVAQIMHQDIIQIVQKAIDHSGISARRLHIEITETLFAENLEQVKEIVAKLQAIGAKVSIDDFGTGFSSLALLQSLSADIVKIDKCFISELEKGGRAIIQATQNIAHDLKYEVVAEGVETLEQVNALKQLGIRNLQGFYFSKPLNLDELNQLNTLQLNQEYSKAESQLSGPTAKSI